MDEYYWLDDDGEGELDFSDPRPHVAYDSHKMADSDLCEIMSQWERGLADLPHFV